MCGQADKHRDNEIDTEIQKGITIISDMSLASKNVLLIRRRT